MAKKALTSRLAQQEEEKKEKEKIKFTKEETDQSRRIRDCMRDSYDQMNQVLDEFDGDSLISTCQQNRLAAVSFLTPILNDGEVRVVTGTTEGKIDSVFNSVFNQNIENNIRAFNENDLEDYRLGDSLTKTVKRTRQIEVDDDINEEILREILSMPAVFIQETMSDEWYYDRVLEEGDWDDLWQFKIPKFKKEGWLRRREAKKVLWTCEQVMLADIKIPMRLFHTQPYVITYRIRSYSNAESVYRHSPRWKNVIPGSANFSEYKGSVESSEWRFSRKLKADEVEEVIYKSVIGDEMQVYLNGVNMLPVGCPYLGTRMKKYDMTMEGGKMIHPKFAYRRPLVSMTKVLQALKDENFRLLVLKGRQDFWKPLIAKTKAVLSKDMWLPSAITYGLDKSEIDVLPGLGGKIGNSDLILNKMIETEVEKFINVSSLFQGIGDQKRTASEVQQLMKQALIGLGATLTGYVRAMRNCTYLRLYNILENMTKPIDNRYNDHLEKTEDVYRTFSIDEVDLYDGKIGTEVISFVNRELLDAEKKTVLKLEKESRENGKPKAFTFLPVDKLLKTPYMFYVESEITEKKTSMLETEMAKKDIIDTAAFGGQVGLQVNPEYAAQEWGKAVRKVDTRKFFVIPPPGGQPGAQPMPPASGGKPVNTPDMGVQQLMNAGS